MCFKSICCDNQAISIYSSNQCYSNFTMPLSSSTWPHLLRKNSFLCLRKTEVANSFIVYFGSFLWNPFKLLFNCPILHRQHWATKILVCSPRFSKPLTLSLALVYPLILSNYSLALTIPTKPHVEEPALGKNPSLCKSLEFAFWNATGLWPMVMTPHASHSHNESKPSLVLSQFDTGSNHWLFASS